MLLFTAYQIILMISVTDKLQPICFTTGLKKPVPLKTGHFNQTILMKNSKFQINFTQDTKAAEEQMSSRGLGSWHLNNIAIQNKNGLVQLGQTPQLKLQKIKDRIDMTRNKSNSPYMIHKARTQDIHSIQKIYGTKQARDPFKEVFSSGRKNGTIEQLSTKSAVRDQSQQLSTLQKLINKRDKTISQKIAKGIRKNINLDSQRNMEALPTTRLDAHQPNPESGIIQTLRRNKFQFSNAVIQQKLKRTNSIHDYDEDLTKTEIHKICKSERCAIPQKLPTFDVKKRVYHKTIESINRSFLNQTDEYISDTYASNVAQQTKIEVFVQTICPPQPANAIKKSSHQNCCEWQYDFKFDEQSKYLKSEFEKSSS